MSIKASLRKNKILNREFLKVKLMTYLTISFCLILIILLVSIWLGFAESIKIVLGSVYSLFLPGFCMSHVILGKREVDVLERLALSFALSVSIIPLIVYYLTIIGIGMSALLTFSTILIVCIMSLVVLYVRKKREDQKKR